ncbi:hypothetical protein STEG23_016899, partial [Scotinomys teguina]
LVLPYLHLQGQLYCAVQARCKGHLQLVRGSDNSPALRTSGPALSHLPRVLIGGGRTTSLLPSHTKDEQGQLSKHVFLK